MQRQIEQQQREYQQQFQKKQEEYQQQYQRDLQRFDEWLKANGGSSAPGKGGAASRLPDNPAAFDQWAETQQYLKARGKPYDPMYDQYRKFVDSMSPNGFPKEGSTAATSNSSERGLQKSNRQNNQQAGATGSTGGDSATGQETKKRGSTETTGTTAGQDTKKSNSAEAAGKTAAQEKDAEREERQRAKLKSEEAARQLRAQERRPQAQDQISINHLKTVHMKLQQADHDYDGNRLRALHSVGEALHHLNSLATGGGVGSGAGNLPKAQSDAILNEAISKLRIVQNRLGGQASSAPHFARALEEVRQAIRHLEAALRIR